MLVHNSQHWKWCSIVLNLPEWGYAVDISIKAVLSSFSKEILNFVPVHGLSPFVKKIFLRMIQLRPQPSSIDHIVTSNQPQMTSKCHCIIPNVGFWLENFWPSRAIRTDSFELLDRKYFDSNKVFTNVK